MSIAVKICGLNDPYAMKAAVEGGAAYVGLVFHAASPRAVNVKMAAELAALVPEGIMKVGLFVNPKDGDLLEVLKDVPLDMIQLHGEEPGKRISSVKGMTGLPVMKAIKLAKAGDLDKVGEYEAVADRLLFDAKMPESPLPGGNGRTFDWSLLTGKTFAKPWMLAGGLNVQNLAEAVRITGAKTVDISSSIEDRPGQKNSAKIRELLAAAKRV